MSAAGVMKAVMTVVPVGVLALASAAWAGECKKVHAELVEYPATEGCLDPARVCFLGEVKGNHGLSGVTHFQAEEGRAAPPGSPGWVSYNGFFHYTLEKGTLVMRETGITGPGIVMAHHQILYGTGEFAGATGYLFVSGTKNDTATLITTQVTGQLCLP